MELGLAGLSGARQSGMSRQQLSGARQSGMGRPQPSRAKQSPGKNPEFLAQESRADKAERAELSRVKNREEDARKERGQ